MLKEQLAKLVSVKSIVTILLTILFMVLAVKGVISGDHVQTIYSIVIAFYFGTQYEKSKSNGGDENAGSN